MTQDRDPKAPRIRVFIAMSLDGYIAGEGDDLSWLPPPPDDGSDFGYSDFMAEIGALLMGRRTYDVVAAFEGPWPYGDRPVLVTTRRPLTAVAPSVLAVSGDLPAIVAQAKAAAAGKDVYVDGGQLIRQTLDAGLVDFLTVTVIPVILGRGSPLFAGAERRHPLDLVHSVELPGGLIQLTYRPRREPVSPA
jgi:dihydrofolate reductase